MSVHEFDKPNQNEHSAPDTPTLTPLSATVLRDPVKLAQATQERQALARARKVAKGQAVAPAAPEKARKVVKLPPWPEAMRACPSCVLRSALFSIVERGERKTYHRAIIAAWSGVVIRYTGTQLDQSDLDVWLLALHLSRQQGLGAQVACSERAFLRLLNRKTSNTVWLKDAMARLTACAVEIRVGTRTYWGPLIEGGYRDEVTGEFIIELNPRLIALFHDVTWQEWEARCQLKKDLAKWLHSYLLSHRATTKNPHRIGLDRLRQLCGSSRERLRDFRTDVREAMAELEAVGAITNWQLTAGDALEVIRPNQRQKALKKPSSD